jgi:hypothetical protein
LNDSTYQQYVNARLKLIQTQAAQKAALEKYRSLSQTRLLVLQYYANLM